MYGITRAAPGRQLFPSKRLSLPFIGALAPATNRKDKNAFFIPNKNDSYVSFANSESISMSFELLDAQPPPLQGYDRLNQHLYHFPLSRTELGKKLLQARHPICAVLSEHLGLIPHPFL